MPFHFVKSYVCLYNSCLTEPELKRELFAHESSSCRMHIEMKCKYVVEDNATYTRLPLALFIWCNNVMNVIKRNMYAVPTTICLFFLTINLLQNPDALGFA